MLISLEGPEGSGKTTIMPVIQGYFENLGMKTVVYREPGGTDVGNDVRDILLNKFGGTRIPPTPKAELLLFLASRAQIVEECIVPQLNAGKNVILDRFIDSTLAYQGGARSVLDMDELWHLNMLATGGLVPDLTILLDLPVEIGLARKNRQAEINRLDIEEVTFHETVRKSYLELATKYKERIVVVDASQSVKDVQADVAKILLERIRVS